MVSAGKPRARVVARLPAEHRERAGAGPIALARAVVAHVPEQLEIRLHRRWAKLSPLATLRRDGDPPGAATARPLRTRRASCRRRDIPLSSAGSRRPTGSPRGLAGLGVAAIADERLRARADDRRAHARRRRARRSRSGPSCASGNFAVRGAEPVRGARLRPVRARATRRPRGETGPYSTPAPRARVAQDRSRGRGRRAGNLRGDHATGSSCARFAGARGRAGWARSRRWAGRTPRSTIVASDPPPSLEAFELRRAPADGPDAASSARGGRALNRRKLRVRRTRTRTSRASFFEFDLRSAKNRREARKIAC